MNGEMDRLLERVRQRREAIERELDASRRPPTRRAFDTRAEHAPGARVFDPVTGQEGEVVGAGSENIIGSTAKR